MKSKRRSKLYMWLIAILTFAVFYLLLRFSGVLNSVLSNNDGNVYKDVLFETGVFLFVLIIMFLAGYYIYVFWDKKNITHQNLLAICILMAITLLLSVILIRFSLFAMPLILVPLILSFITDRRTAEIMTIIMTLVILPFTYTAPVVIFMNLFTGYMGIALATKVNQRREFPVMGIVLAASNFLAIFIFYSIMGFEFDVFLKYSVISGGVTFGCVIATIGLLPFFETISGIISTFALMDLANPANKLLKRLTVEAPGTYYHSIMVGNLAEAAAEKIGANAILARVAAYYHDIGKLKEPLYFMENQHAENIHDTLDPYESVSIITQHTRDGVKLAEKYKLPPQIIEIISQHHGDTTVAWFYNKACNAAGEYETVALDDFRYKENKPSSIEAAIIMLADSVEAGTKALADKSIDKIKYRVDTVVTSKIADGQLDNCPLTLSDINIIKKQFVQSIGAYYHKRDEYPGATTIE